MKPENMNIDAITALTMLSLISDYSDDLVTQIDHETASMHKPMVLDVTDMYEYAFSRMGNKYSHAPLHIAETVYQVICVILELNGLTGCRFEQRVVNNRIYYLTTPFVDYSLYSTENVT